MENMAGMERISNTKLRSEQIQQGCQDFNNMVNSFTLGSQNFEPVAIKPLKDDKKIQKFFQSKSDYYKKLGNKKAIYKTQNDEKSNSQDCQDLGGAL